MSVWIQFRKNRIGMGALAVLALFVLFGLYAPFFASSKPLVVTYEGKVYFPLFRYLFYRGFYTKPLDIFYNTLMFILPLTLVGLWLFKRSRSLVVWVMVILQCALFALFLTGFVKDPGARLDLELAKQKVVDEQKVFRNDPLLAPFPPVPKWQFELTHMTDYGKLNRLLRYKQRQQQDARLSAFSEEFKAETGREIPTLWRTDVDNERRERDRLRDVLNRLQGEYEVAQTELPSLTAAYRPFSHDFLRARYDLEQAMKEGKGVEEAKKEFEKVLHESSAVRIPLERTRQTIQSYRESMAKLTLLRERKQWLEKESQRVHVLVPALFRSFHWEDDAGGEQSLNKFVPWWELTRVNRKDLVAALLFGVRISLVVGFSAVALSLLIGIPLGMLAGYFVGRTDIIISRLIEIWEAMPTFFMLLLVIAITQQKSIFLVVAVLGIFGWTGFGRFIRGEVLKQRGLPYVLACHNLGFPNRRIMFSHILPNAIPPILTLLPFSLMAAITSEAGISFLGLGEEGSTSWGVLMAEGRSVFPGESYLIWPPAILLTLLLVAIALVGDAFRDALDPKMR